MEWENFYCNGHWKHRQVESSDELAVQDNKGVPLELYSIISSQIPTRPVGECSWRRWPEEESTKERCIVRAPVSKRDYCSTDQSRVVAMWRSISCLNFCCLAVNLCFVFLCLVINIKHQPSNWWQLVFKKNFKAQWDGMVGKSTCCQVRWPEFNSWDPCGRRGEPNSSHLSSHLHS